MSARKAAGASPAVKKAAVKKPVKAVKTAAPRSPAETAAKRSTKPVADATPPPATTIAPLADEYLAVLIVALANRLSRGAASHYARHFEIGMADYRIVLALGLAKGLNMGAVAAAADVDKAAASRSLRFLSERGFVELEQTASRGRAAIVHLTPAGAALERELKKSSQARQRRFISMLSAAERDEATRLLKKLIAAVPHMNQD